MILIQRCLGVLGITVVMLLALQVPTLPMRKAATRIVALSLRKVAHVMMNA